MARSKGEGTIYQRPDGYWVAQVTINGRRKSKVSKKKSVVQAWRKEMTAKLQQGYQGASETLGEYLERWLPSKKNSLKHNTYAKYELNIRKYILPELGNVRLEDLTADLVQYVWDSYIQDGVGAHTVIKVHNILHAALNRAVKTGQIWRNVTDAVEKPVAEDVEMKFLTEAEALHFLSTARDSRLYALFYLAVVTGARQMELCGLQWSDIDWGRRTLSIRRQLARKGKTFTSLKTRQSNRTLSLGDATMEVLQEHLERQAQERMLAGEKWKEHNLIFTSTTGTPLQHKNLYNRYFKPLVKKASIPDIRFHDLRHTAAAIMLTNGRPPIVVSRILGHARVSITSDIYGHLIPGADAGAIEMMEELVTPGELVALDLPR